MKFYKFEYLKYVFFILVFLLSLIYSLPNIYMSKPCIKINLCYRLDYNNFNNFLYHYSNNINIKIKSIIKKKDDEIWVVFFNMNDQLSFKNKIFNVLDNQFNINLDLFSNKPYWLNYINANSMKYGLDLLGGVKFIINIDTISYIKKIFDYVCLDIEKKFNVYNIEFTKMKIDYNKLNIIFLTYYDFINAKNYIKDNYTDLIIKEDINNNNYCLNLEFGLFKISKIEADILEQTMNVLRNRINELGINDANVKKYSVNQISVELSGIQNIDSARSILGKTANVYFYFVKDMVNDNKYNNSEKEYKLLYDKFNNKILLYNNVILSGDSIVNTTYGYSNYDNKPIVNVVLSKNVANKFNIVTSKNIGKYIAVVYHEIEYKNIIKNNVFIKEKIENEKIISIAKIMEPLGSKFQISGFDIDEAVNLSIILKSGSLPTSIYISEETVIGPIIGERNIYNGIRSMIFGVILVFSFMIFYYRYLGIIASLILLFNMLSLVAVMSVLGATLTLFGIAGIILTLGMAVDANVLIFERIKEEYKSSKNYELSIKQGFDNAFTSILDANITTLIAGIILFFVATGAIKGFAVTLSIGILTSVYSSIIGTRIFIVFLLNKKLLEKSL